VSIAVGRVGSPGEVPAPASPAGVDASAGVASDATLASPGVITPGGDPPEDEVDPLEDPPEDFEAAVPLEDPLGEPLEDPEPVECPLDDPPEDPEAPVEDPVPVPEELPLPDCPDVGLVDAGEAVLPVELPLLAQPGMASKANHPAMTIRVDDRLKRFDFEGATIRSSACRALDP
jgi:hypothetical protein